MSGTFQGQSLGSWVRCDPPSPKRTHLLGIVISPVKTLSDQDKPVHAALVLSVSRYCGHVNSHFHHNWPRFWQNCSAGPGSLYSSVSSPSSPLLFLVGGAFFCSAATQSNKYGSCRVKLCLLPSLSFLYNPICVMDTLITWTDPAENMRENTKRVCWWRQFTVCGGIAAMILRFTRARFRKHTVELYDKLSA